MNNQLIEKIIQANGGLCPKSPFSNPVVDKDVAKALSKSFVKILHISKENSSINNNLRMSILENIRRLCTLEPEGHLPIDENVTESLAELYRDELGRKSVQSTDKDVDAFLIRNFKSLQIDSHYQPSINPEIIQALINLNDNGVYLEILTKEIIHLDLNKGNLNLIKSLWNSEDGVKSDVVCYDDIAIKMKADIEKTLLNICYSILSDNESDITSQFNNAALINLVKKSAVSSECFQICYSVLNFLFIMTNFDSKLQLFIAAFVKEVKINCPHVTFTVLYPPDINNTILLLDIDLNELPEPLKSSYVTPSINLLRKVREKSEYDFIMVLSHFPQWFDIYFSRQSDKLL